MPSTILPTVHYKIYIVERSNNQSSGIDQLTTYFLHYTEFAFDTEQQAVSWIEQLGEKGHEYVILKTYQVH